MAARDQDGVEIECRAGGALGTNSFGIRDKGTGAWAIVDPVGGSVANWGDWAEAHGAPGAIFVTHGHFDHIEGGAECARAWPGTPIWVHRESAPMLGDPALNLAALAMLPCEPFRGTAFYREGDAVEVGGIRLKVLEVPGHCPGSVALAGDGFVFGGDALFEGSVGRWDLPGGDAATLGKSIREKLMTLPDATAVYPGHGPATTIGAERRGNPIVRAMLAGEAIE